MPGSPSPEHPVPPPAASPVPTPVPPGAGAGAAAATWFSTGLAVVLGLALVLWPYPSDCGLDLIFYLGAAALTLLAGIWGATISWRHRRGLPHCLSLLTIVWAAILLAGDVLPRIGYAKAERTWLCP